MCIFLQGINKNIAKQVLMFMVVGVSAPIKASIAYFGTTCAEAGSLYFYLWEAVMHLELTCGLKVCIKIAAVVFLERYLCTLGHAVGYPYTM